MTLNETWRKSTKSNNNGACAEVRRPATGGVQIRDTKDDGQGYSLSFTDNEWDAFIDGVKKGEFDLA